MHYLRDLRMERARAELLSGESHNIAAVALRWGFAHMGRFSAGYKARYGESPSQSVRRCGGEHAWAKKVQHDGAALDWGRAGAPPPALERDRQLHVQLRAFWPVLHLEFLLPFGGEQPALVVQVAHRRADPERARPTRGAVRSAVVRHLLEGPKA
ncbi:hypothetical protein G6F68_017277 [Rhizopus microsporus]|nr:hypothetical protein G6F68_017277 [Rhizopus microsporus]